MTMATPIKVGHRGGTGSTLATNGFTPSAPASLLVACWGRRSTVGTPAVATITSSPALTWNALTFTPDTIGTTTYIRIGASWAAVPTATPVAMTVTASVDSGPKTSMIVTEFPGAHPGITNLGSDDDASGDPVAVMDDTPDGMSLSFAFGMFAGTDMPVAPATGFTELFANLNNTDCITQVAYHLTPTDTVTWSSTNVHSMGAIMEIKPAGTNRSAAVGLWFS
jgi:hypothetical protein